MTKEKKTYLPRLVDKKIKDYLSVFGAVSIEGPKWCGKTWTSLNHSKSSIFMDDDTNRDMALLDVKAVKYDTDLESALLTLEAAVNDKEKFSFKDHINGRIMEDYFNGVGSADSIRTATRVDDAGSDNNSITVFRFLHTFILHG